MSINTLKIDRNHYQHWMEIKSPTIRKLTIDIKIYDRLPRSILKLDIDVDLQHRKLKFLQKSFWVDTLSTVKFQYMRTRRPRRSSRYAGDQTAQTFQFRISQKPHNIWTLELLLSQHHFSVLCSSGSSNTRALTSEQLLLPPYNSHFSNTSSITSLTTSL